MEKTALLVIDMQNGFLSPDSPLFIAGAPETVPICADVINFCRNKGIPVFFVTREYSADGSNVEHTRYDVWLKGGKPLSPGCEKSISSAMPEVFGVCDRDFLLIKPRYSAFFNTGLDLILRRKGIRHVWETGLPFENDSRKTGRSYVISAAAAAVRQSPFRNGGRGNSGKKRCPRYVEWDYL